ncbi:MAG: hypothetical protein ISS35_09980, partial [Kiritimatiellae bacterium]|nr:hypothetical protein [Kiritimatiellia bacterium]
EYRRPGEWTLPGSIAGATLEIDHVDTDHDSLADAWEYAYFGADFMDPTPTSNYDRDADPDEDGSSNFEEQNRGTDPTEADTDGDGIPDGVDEDPLDPDTNRNLIPDGSEEEWGLDLTDPDEDNDLIITAAEVAWDGSADYTPYDVGTGTGTDLDAQKADTDGDGVNDFMEIAAGSDPLDPLASAMVVITDITVDLGSGKPQVSWGVAANQAAWDVTFRLVSSVDLTNWTSVGQLTVDGSTDGTVSLLDSTNEGVVFYRVVVDQIGPQAPAEVDCLTGN